MQPHPALPVSNRIDKLRADLFATQTQMCFARAEIATRSYRQTQGEHWAIRRAKALHAIFSEIPLFIREGELLVGQRAAILAGRSVYPEFNLNGLKQETTPPEIWDYWKGQTLRDEVHALYPEQLNLAESERASGYCTGSGSGFGHVIIDYEKALTKGFRAIIQEADEQLQTAPRDDIEGQNFLKAVKIAAQGIIIWAGRYAELAEKQAATESNPQRQKELEHIATICKRVPAEPPRNFHEALQSFWFVHLAMHIEQYGWSISAGRFDQYMFPYFKTDLSTGLLTETQAWELLLNLWVKFMENVGTKLKATVFQNLTLGGQDTHGVDQSNALSHMCLNATVAMQFNQPALSVRWHPNVDPDFWDHAHQTIAQGLGFPALFNDDVIIPALTSHGVSREDATGYGIVGCVEACVPGKQQGVTAGGHLNIAKALELALNNGRSMVTGRLIGLPTGDPETFNNFDDLWQAYVDQVHYLSGLNVQATQISGVIQKKRGHCPLMSALLSDCLSKRRDLVFGGTRYNLPGVSILGNSNVYDGMMAIQKLICDGKRLTWAELRRALLEDFKGHERIQQMLAHRAPRFGNDEPEVDALANKINAVHADFFWKHVDARNGRYTCGVWPVEGHVHSGTWTGATPDGRRSGAPIADGVGACHGADRNGPTALLASVAQLNHPKHWAAGNTCNIKFSKTALNTDQALDRLQELTTTYMRLKGQQLQINVVNAETLRDAQAHPEQYENLIVRVAGFSAYFTQLSTKTQEEIISRTEQSL